MTNCTVCENGAVFVTPFLFKFNKNTEAVMKHIKSGTFFYREETYKFVYVISNPKISPKEYKIGMTNDKGFIKFKEYNHDNSVPFLIHAILFYDKPSELEAVLKRKLKIWNINEDAGTEFFNCTFEELENVIRSYYSMENSYPYLYSESGLSFDDYIISLHNMFKMKIEEWKMYDAELQFQIDNITRTTELQCPNYESINNQPDRKSPLLTYGDELTPLFRYDVDKLQPLLKYEDDDNKE